MRRLPFVLFAAFLAILSPADAASVPNDPYYVVQWGLKKVEAVRAWQVTRGAGSVIAVVDTGVDPGHPDLQGRLLRGRDFADDDNDPRDDNGHGTLVAGIIAATTGNEIGVASLAPEAKILPVRVLGSDGSGTSQDVAAGIRWASSYGADVINLSLAEEGEHGGPGFQLPAGLLNDPSVNQAIVDAAVEGAVVVVAAGNSSTGGTSQTAYDATQPGVVVVGASASDDKRAAYSNYGDGLDLLAPGGGSSTDPSDAGCTRDNSIVSLWWNHATHRSDYGGGCGTSMAVAFASGLAALLHTRGLNNQQIASRMIATAKDLGPAGPDAQTGAGRIDAAAALGAPPLSAPPRSRKLPAATSSRRSIVTQASASPRALPSRPGERARVDAVAPVAPRSAGSDPRTLSIEIASTMVCLLGLAHWLRYVTLTRRR